MQKDFTRRRFLQQSARIALAAGMAGGALTGCTNVFDTLFGSNSGSAPGTLVFWHTYSLTNQENPNLVNKVIPAFKKVNPNINVVSQDIPYSGMLQKLIAAIASGSGPDIIRSDIIWIPQMARIQALVPLDDLVAQRKDEFYAGPLQTCFYQGHYYALPLDTNTKVVLYNQDLFTQAGVQQAPATTADFRAVAQKISSLGHNIFGYAESAINSWTILPWIWCFGGSVTDKNYTKASDYLNSSRTVEALQFLVDLYDQQAISPTILGGGGAGTSDALGKGQVGMIIDGPWIPPILQSTYAKVKFGQAQLPAGPGAHTASVIGGEDIAIMRASKNLEAAKTFAQFMTSSQAQIVMGQAGQMPVLKSVANDRSLPAFFQTYNQQLTTALPRPVHPNYTQIDSALTDAFNRAFRHQGTPKEVLDGAAPQVDALLQA